MKVKIFTIHDSKAEAYNTPFFMTTKGQAIRAFQDEANNPQSNICKHSADYTLFEIGEYDDLQGSIQLLETKINHGLALDYKNNLQ